MRANRRLKPAFITKQAKVAKIARRRGPKATEVCYKHIAGSMRRSSLASLSEIRLNL
jgi:hypothetical protein